MVCNGNVDLFWTQICNVMQCPPCSFVFFNCTALHTLSYSGHSGIHLQSYCSYRLRHAFLCVCACTKQVGRPSIQCRPTPRSWGSGRTMAQLFSFFFVPLRKHSITTGREGHPLLFATGARLARFYIVLVECCDTTDILRACVYLITKESPSPWRVQCYMF